VEISKAFGDLDGFKHKFSDAALGQFGSGWAWLVENAGKLEILKTSNAENPLPLGKRPLLVCDVWEHAYYVDYQNRRADYVKSFLDHLVDWEAVSQRLLAR
jgi:Fe-Mn family superoxide dismutase